MVLALCVEARGAWAAPFAAVTLNGSAFHRGDTITYQVTLTPDATPRQVDIYLGTLLPDGRTFLSLVQSSPGVISTAVGPAPIPFLANVPLTQTVVPFSYTFTGGEPVGTYVTHAIISTAGKPPVLWNRLDVAYQSFQFNSVIIIETTSQLIKAASGGTVVLPNGSRVAIAPGVLATDQKVTLSLLSSLPTQPPSGLITSTGPVLSLSFSPVGPSAGAPASEAIALLNEGSPPSTGIEFTLDLSKTTATNINGSLPIGQFSSPTSGEAFVGVPGVRTSSNVTMTFSPDVLKQFEVNVSNTTINAGLGNMNPKLPLRPPTYGARQWDSKQEKWVDFDPSSVQGQKVCVLTHGVFSSVEGAFHEGTGCATRIGKADGCDVVLGFNYKYYKHPEAAGSDFSTFLNTLKANNVREVIIEAHSLGGVVALAGAGQANPNLNITKIVTLSSPLMGTPAAATAENLVTSLLYYPLDAVLEAQAGVSLPEEAGRGLVEVLTPLGDLSPNSDTLKEIRERLASRRPNTEVLTVATVKFPEQVKVPWTEQWSLVPPQLRSFIYGSEATDIFVPLSSASADASGLPRHTHVGTFDLLHEEVECNSRVIDDVGQAVTSLLHLLSVTPDSLDFGSVGIGSSADRTFTVQNTSSGTLSGMASTSGAPFSIVSGGTYNLTAGQTQMVTVRFSPTSGGTSVGNVTFTGGGGATRAVSGVGTAGLTLTCPASVQVGKTGTCTVTVDLPQNITTVPLSSSDAGVLAVPSSVTLFLANQNTSTFTITGVATGTATVTAGPVNGVTATATVKVQSGGPTLLDHTMTKVRPTGCTAPPRVSTSSPPSFQTTDTEADSWIRVSGVQPGDAVQWEWHRPDGSKYTTSTSNNTSLTGEACFWGWMYIAGHEPSTVSGTWSVRVLYNGTQLLSESFTIGAPPPPPPPPTGGERWTGTLTGTLTLNNFGNCTGGKWNISGTITMTEPSGSLVNLFKTGSIGDVPDVTISDTTSVTQQPPPAPTYPCTLQPSSSSNTDNLAAVAGPSGTSQLQVLSAQGLIMMFPECTVAGSGTVCGDVEGMTIIRLTAASISSTTISGTWVDPFPNGPANTPQGTFTLTKQ